MTSYSSITIAGSTISDFVNYRVSKSTSSNQIVSNFTGELNKISCEPFVQYSPVLLSCSKYDCDGEIWKVK